MKYNYKGKDYTVNDNEIDAMMEKLDISLAEACEMYLADHDIISDETEKKLTQKAQKNRITATIHDAKGEKKERKPREKKENPLKKEIIQTILDGMLEKYPFPNWFNVTNDEKYIDFTIDNRSFTINLVEHREKKNKK